MAAGDECYHKSGYLAGNVMGWASSHRQQEAPSGKRKDALELIPAEASQSRKDSFIDCKDLKESKINKKYFITE
jgi:hypothetical protein